MFRTNTDPEFMVNSCYASKDILHQKYYAKTPQHNIIVERKHQHVLNVGRVLLYQSNMPKNYWSYVILYATFIINTITTPLLNDI